MIERAKTSPAHKHHSGWSVRLLKFFVLLGGIFLFAYSFVADTTNAREIAEPDRTLAEGQEIDYSHFGHNNPAHGRLPCLVCHRRDDNSPRIGFPGKIDNLPCAGCHTDQFSGNTSPICTICHTDTGMKRFPGLQSFGARFDHSRHGRVSCAVCHKTEGRGIARSIPSGSNAHITCFQCHSANASNEMASCSTCHSPGKLVRTQESAVSFRRSFSHVKHFDKGNLNCAVCHGLSGSAARGRQMTSPLPSMHFAPERSLSCGACHNGKRAFGPDDFVN